MNRYEFEERALELLGAATFCLRAFAYAVPYIVLALSAKFVMQTALAQPYTLTCKTLPTTEKMVRSLPKKRPEPVAPSFGPAEPEGPPAPIIKANPVEID